MAISFSEAKRNVRSRLLDRDYLKVPYALMNLFDGDTTNHLAFLVHCELHNQRRKQLDDNGMFMAKRSFIQGKIGQTKKVQERVCKVLVDHGLILRIVKGMPPTNWIKINHIKLNELLDKYADEYDNTEDY